MGERGPKAGSLSAKRCGRHRKPPVVHEVGSAQILPVPSLPAIPPAPDGELANPWAAAECPHDAFRNPYNPNEQRMKHNEWERALAGKVEAWEAMRGAKAAEWDSIVKEMREGLTFSTICRSAIDQYVESWWRAQLLEKKLDEEGWDMTRKSGTYKHPLVDVLMKVRTQINKCLNDLGLTPAGRRRAFMETQKKMGPSFRDIMEGVE